MTISWIYSMFRYLRLLLRPPRPTSELPGYPIKFTTIQTTINTLNDDILFGIFNYYGLDDDNAWNVRLGCKISHVCRRWRHVVHSSAFHLGMHILCTNGTPIVDTLNHLPSLPLFIDFRDTAVTISLHHDKLAIHHALLLRDRVRHIDLRFPPSILYKFLMLMDEPFSILEHLSLSSTSKEDTILVLPKACLTPNLRHLTLLGINLPKRLRLLSSTVALVTLALTDIRASGYFPPRLLAARLQSLPRLKELTIGFSIPMPRPSAETELLKQGTPMMLPNLKHLTFKGVSAYLECLVAQIRAPLLERLDITFFNQIVFVLPHLSRLINISDAFKLPSATVFFGNEVSIITQRYGGPSSFTLRVMCMQLDWQIDCAAQICRALIPALSGVQKLTLDFDGPMMLTEWENGEIDGTTWHELLRSFTGVNGLHICGALSQELSRALRVGQVGLAPGFLPGLQEIQFYEGADRLFGSFIHARLVASRPIRLR
jgi:hypothetical protein